MSGRDIVRSHLPDNSFDVPSLDGVSPKAVLFIGHFMNNNARAILSMNISEIEEPDIRIVASIYIINLLYRTKRYDMIEQHIDYIEQQTTNVKAIFDFVVANFGPYGLEGHSVSIMENPECNTKIDGAIRCIINYQVSPSRLKVLRYLVILFDQYDVHIEHEQSPYIRTGWDSNYHESNFLFYQLFLLFATKENSDTDIIDVMGRMSVARGLEDKTKAAQLYEMVKSLDLDSAIITENWKQYWEIYFNPSSNFEQVIQILKNYVGYGVLRDPKLVFGSRLRFLTLLDTMLKEKSLVVEQESTDSLVTLVNQEYEEMSKFVEANIGQAGEYSIYLEFYYKFLYYSIMLFINEDPHIRQQFLKICMKKLRFTHITSESFALFGDILDSYVKLGQHDEAIKFYLDKAYSINKGIESSTMHHTYKIRILAAIATAAQAESTDVYFMIFSEQYKLYSNNSELARAVDRVKDIAKYNNTISSRSLFEIGIAHEEIENECLICCNEFKNGMYTVKCKQCDKYIGHLQCISEYIMHSHNVHNVICPHCRIISSNRFLESMARIDVLLNTLEQQQQVSTPPPAVAPPAVAPPAPVRIRDQRRRPSTESAQRVIGRPARTSSRRLGY